MCGIAGKVSFTQKPVVTTDLVKMAEAIAHRGPDDSGTYLSPDRKVGLANRRLAIIDLSPAGHMPMSLKNRYWITFNGEIYNFQTERQALEKTGYRFRSSSDTEVILALYDKYGAKCLDHLRGMFAFAIYDSAKNTLFLARDRLGKKPLKYYADSSVFIFASELKALFTQGEVRKSPDFVAIHHYLTFGYAPAPLTGFENIQKLPPAHYLLLDIKTGKAQKKRYWFPDYNTKLALTEAEWRQRILSTLDEAVKLRLVSDVPLGAFLSGGTDSSAIVALMAKHSSTPVKTFSIGFKEKSHDETKYAKSIATLYQTDHTEFVVEPESLNILPNLIRQFEEPFANSSFLISYLVAKMAREKVTVILNGDGGDENFAGYDARHFRLQRDVFADKFAPLLDTFGLPVAKLLGKTSMVRFLEKRQTPLADRYLSYNIYLENKDKNALYLDRFKSELGDINSYELVRQKFEESRAGDPRDQALYYDLTSYFPDDLLAKSDLSAMAVSLEGRSPFADHKAVELACQIPFDLKVKGGITKYILKKSLEDLVPKENLYRAKMGFSIPLGKWFNGDLGKYAQTKLFDKRAFTTKIFDQNAVAKLLDSHSQQNDVGLKLWPILSLELWFEEYFG